MKRKMLIAAAAVIVTAIALGGCGNVANRSTVDRTTAIPQFTENAGSTEIEKRAEEGGVAIHLDAQQRLVLATAKGYCAEPSPDALSAYVATLGVGATTPSQAEAAVSFANALQGSAASIGLRTQSITLMRDALYRMCEAANNGNLDGIHVARFLRRSQDLTAVILAVEQLTGTVAANQVLLTPESSANASANLTANQQLLDQQRQTVQRHENTVEEARSELADAEVARHTAETEYNTKLKALKDASDKASAPEPPTGNPSPADPPVDAPGTVPSAGVASASPPLETGQLSGLEAEAKQAKSTLEKAEERVRTAESHLALEQQRLEDAEEVLRAIELSRNAALTNVTSETRSSGQFSSVVQRNKLDVKSTEAIAKAVSEMVNTVVQKDDIKELCVSYVISDRELRQEQSEGQQQLISVANREIDAATVSANNAKNRYREAEEEAIVANDAHLSAIAEFDEAQSRADQFWRVAEQVNDEVLRLTNELSGLSERSEEEAPQPEGQSTMTVVKQKTELEDELRQAKAEARQARDDARKAQAGARQAEANANRREVDSTTAERKRDLARQAAHEEKQQLEKFRARRDQLVEGVTKAITSEDIGAVAEQICRQVILPGGSGEPRGG